MSAGLVKGKGESREAATAGCPFPSPSRMLTMMIPFCPESVGESEGGRDRQSEKFRGVDGDERKRRGRSGNLRRVDRQTDGGRGRSMTSPEAAAPLCRNL